MKKKSKENHHYDGGLNWLYNKIKFCELKLGIFLRKIAHLRKYTKHHSVFHPIRRSSKILAAPWFISIHLPRNRYRMKTAFRVCWYMNFNLIQIRKCIWIYDLECTRHLLEHQDKYCFETISKGKNMRLYFANGIYFKVASQVNIKTQIELEIWANCSGHRRKKFFRCTFFLCGSDK